MRVKSKWLSLKIVCALAVCLSTTGCATNLMTRQQSAEMRARERTADQHLDEVQATIQASGEAGALVVPIKENKTIRIVLVKGSTPEEAWMSVSDDRRAELLAPDKGGGVAVWVYASHATPPPEWIDLRRLNYRVRTDATTWQALALVKEFHQQAEPRLAAFDQSLNQILLGFNASEESRKAQALQLDKDLKKLKEQFAIVRSRVESLQ